MLAFRDTDESDHTAMVSIAKDKEENGSLPYEDSATAEAPVVVLADIRESQAAGAEDRMSGVSKCIAVVVLLTVNLLNYMDRSTVAGR